MVREKAVDKFERLAYIASMTHEPATLGELETLLLLAILQLTEQGREAYGSLIRDEIDARADRTVPRGSIYITLDRLEEKGLLASHEGRTSAARGHRPKRVFKVTPAGLRAVKSAVSAVIRMQRGLAALLGNS
jgi:DNA-binding PadR family transcriptional regulator